MRFSKLSIVAAVAALAIVGFTFDAGVLKVAPKKDDVRKYAMKGQMEFGGQQAEITGKVTDRIMDVADNGNYTTKSVQSDIAVNGASVGAPETATTSVSRPDGTLVEIRGDAATPEAYRLSTVNTLKLPDVAMAKDLAWTWDCPADKKTGVVKTKGEYKVLGEEKLHDIDTWKISVKVTELEGDTPASTVGTAWVNKTDGTMVKVDGKGTNLPIPGVGAVSGTMTLDLVVSK